MLTLANSYLVNWSYLCGVMDVVHLCGVSMTRGIGQLNILIRINAVIANHARSDAVAQLRDLTRSVAVGLNKYRQRAPVRVTFRGMSQQERNVSRISSCVLAFYDSSSTCICVCIHTYIYPYIYIYMFI